MNQTRSRIHVPDNHVSFRARTGESRYASLACLVPFPVAGSPNTSIVARRLSKRRAIHNTEIEMPGQFPSRAQHAQIRAIRLSESQRAMVARNWRRCLTEATDDPIKRQIFRSVHLRLTPLLSSISPTEASGRQSMSKSMAFPILPLPFRPARYDYRAQLLICLGVSKEDVSVTANGCAFGLAKENGAASTISESRISKKHAKRC